MGKKFRNWLLHFDENINLKHTAENIYQNNYFSRQLYMFINIIGYQNIGSFKKNFIRKYFLRWHNISVTQSILLTRVVLSKRQRHS